MLRSLAVLTTCSMLAAQVQDVGVWVHPTPPLSPVGRQAPLLAFDATRGVAVMTGGVTGGNLDPRTYEWNGATWRFVGTIHQLVGSNVAARICYSPLRGKVVAVRSEVTLGPTPVEMLEWNGNDWVPLATNSAPSSRGDTFQLCWDDARAVLVMFGGGPWWSDTWEWDGAAWTQRGTGGPPGRRNAGMAYDAARQRTVLYGGERVDASGRLTDTWEWDGVVWRERFGMAPPPLRGTGSGMTYDPRRQRVVLFGGEASSSVLSDAVFEYDGLSWQRLTCIGGPPGVSGTALCYDSSRDRTIAYGGHAGPAGLLDAWEFEHRTGIVASFGPHGAGCAGPVGVPTLSAVGDSRPVLGGAFQLRYAQLPNTPLALVYSVLGFDDQTWNATPLPLDLTAVGAPGCLLRVRPELVTPLSNNSGAATITVPIPTDPALDGVPFFVQGIVLSSTSNAAGIVVSDSGRGVVGGL